jgi:hypothetical protein
MAAGFTGIDDLYALPECCEVGHKKLQASNCFFKGGHRF